MSCAAIMTKEPPCILEDDLVAEAAAKLLALHHTSLPVVDAARRFIGMFGVYDLLGLLLPRVALAGNLMSNLRFADDLNGLRRRYEEIKTKRVVEVADRNRVMVQPDTSEIEAVRLCFLNHTPVPVVETETGTLVGLISCGDALRALAGTPAPACR